MTMTITTHRDASFYVVAILEPSRGAEGAECWGASAFDEARDHVLLLFLLLFLYPPSLPSPCSFFACRSPSCPLPPMKAAFSNDRQRGLRHRGNLLALRRIRADCLPLGVSKRTQTSLTPTLSLPRPGETRLYSAEVRSRFNVTCDLPGHSVYTTDSLSSALLLFALTSSPREIFFFPLPMHKLSRDFFTPYANFHAFERSLDVQKGI